MGLVLALNVVGSFRFEFYCFRLYNCIPTILQSDVTVAFNFPLDKLAQDPYDVVICSSCYPNGVLFYPLMEGQHGIRKRELDSNIF